MAKHGSWRRFRMTHKKALSREGKVSWAGGAQSRGGLLSGVALRAIRFTLIIRFTLSDTQSAMGGIVSPICALFRALNWAARRKKHCGVPFQNISFGYKLIMRLLFWCLHRPSWWINESSDFFIFLWVHYHSSLAWLGQFYGSFCWHVGVWL